ncbi:uncharacterized protein Dwil_GK27335 [Drosophila willistoni]|uniref:Uncharacterized protein n=1 Tax=Drosophila willistoni TaxID=7260 RepID=A0A0Q9X0C9_DROWI|nr:uncharacterized protein Dwil_GK27335 [Drosophila willistoni]
MRHHLLLGLCLGIFMHANLANGSIFGLFGKNDVIDPSCNCSRIKIDGSLQLNQFLQGFLVKLAQTYNQLVHGIRPQIGSEQIEGNAPRYGYELIFRILNPKNKEEQHLPSYEIPPQTSNITISIEDIQKYPNNGVIDLPDLSPIPRPPESYVIITTLIQNYLSTQAAGSSKTTTTFVYNNF